MNLDSLFYQMKYKGVLSLKQTEKIIDQVIGQNHAKEIVKIAAKNRRNVLLIGSPGIGKSMLGKAYSELQPSYSTYDIIAKQNPDNPFRPKILLVKAGNAEPAIQDYAEQMSIKPWTQKLRSNIFYIIFSLILGKIMFFDGFNTTSILLLLLVLISFETWKAFQINQTTHGSPKDEFEILIKGGKSPFVDATGQADNGLFGDVLHDPYQSGNLAIPAHKRLIPGSVHRANGGTLYIDEIGTLKYSTQIKLLSVLQEKKLPISGNSEGSSSSAVRSDPIPCDFALVAAGNKETVNLLHPALRSRFQGYGYEVMLPNETKEIPNYHSGLLQFISQEIKKQKNQMEFSQDAVWALLDLSRILAETYGYVTLKFRELGGFIRRSVDLATNWGADSVGLNHIYVAFFISSLNQANDLLTMEIIKRFKSENSCSPAQFDEVCHEIFSELNTFENSTFYEFSSSPIPHINPADNLSPKISLSSVLKEIQDLNSDTEVETIIKEAMQELGEIDIFSFYRWFIHRLGKEKNVGRIFFLCSLNQGNVLTPILHTYKQLRQFRWIFHPNDLLFLPSIDLSYYHFTSQFKRVIQGQTLAELILNTYHFFND
ncbi:MAG: hypothetical protein D6732_29675 [Methanobacteriota archaeon]|nr:MAG: hypothetical protein D6732_29675 [Euryarchaeota archaeon]